MLNYRTYAEIDLNKLQDNLKKVRAFVGPECKIMQVLKANAYGHGLRVCAKYAAAYVDWFAAATMEEAMAIRLQAPDTPILLLGSLLDSEVEEASKNRITINVFSYCYAKHIFEILDRNGIDLDCHIKIDTGMNRLGIRARIGETEPAVAEIEKIYALNNLHVTGMYTHFPVSDSDDEEDIQFTEMQYTIFQDVVDALQRRNYSVGICHCDSTGGLLCHPEYKADMVRVGMMGFGQSISKQSASDLGLEPILKWYSRIIDIRNVSKGESVSYGRLYRAEEKRMIAVASVGYADGLLRAYTGKMNVIVGDQLCSVVGKICMDYIMIDVTGLKVSVGDPIILLGKTDRVWISADDLAALTDYNTNGGVTAGINDRVARVYLFNGKVIDEQIIQY